MGLAVILAIVGEVLGYWPWWIILCVVGAYIAFAMALGRHYAYKAIRSDIALAERRAKTGCQIGFRLHRHSTASDCRK